MPEPKKRNIGGNENTEGEGGPLSDSVIPDLTSPTNGRTLANAKSKRTPSKILVTPKLITTELSEQKDSRKELKLELEDVVITAPSVRSSTGEIVQSTEKKIVAKPENLQVSFDEIDVEYGLPGYRIRFVEVDGGTLEIPEAITPPYEEDEPLYTIDTDLTNLEGIHLVDLNVAARRWEASDPLVQRFRIKEVKKDYYNCYPFFNGAEIVPEEAEPGNELYTEVAKPDELRGSHWEAPFTWNDGIGDITYVDDSGDTDWASRVASRTGGTTEDQAIHPPWLNDKTIITAIRMDIGTGVAGVLWMDLNNGNHGFAEVYA